MAAEIDKWLREGGWVVTASDRAARALSDAFHRARQAEGLTAWAAPNIFDWKSFVRKAWEERGADARLLLNTTQESALWVEIAGEERALATLLEGPRHRLADLAMEAHELLCSTRRSFSAQKPAAAGSRTQRLSAVGWRPSTSAAALAICSAPAACRSK